MNRSLGKIIKDYRECKNFTGQDLADLWDGSKGSVSAIESGKQKPGYEILSSLRRTGMSIDALIDEAECLANRSIVPNNMAVIPVFRFAGAGPPVMTDYEPVGQIVVDTSEIPEGLTFVRVRGRSMEPFIPHNSIVGIDNNDKEPMSGEIYGVWIADEGSVIKRVFWEGGVTRLKSDNPIHKDIEIRPNNGHEFHLMGRVRAIIQVTPK